VALFLLKYTDKEGLMEYNEALMNQKCGMFSWLLLNGKECLGSA